VHYFSTMAQLKPFGGQPDCFTHIRIRKPSSPLVIETSREVDALHVADTRRTNPHNNPQNPILADCNAILKFCIELLSV